MKILVGYKRVVDYNVRIQVKPDGSGVVTDGVKLSPNPFDDIALEEALRLRDKGIATEVVIATIAPADAQPHLRNGLAMGANRAIHVVADGPVQPLTAARALLKLVEKEQPQLVLLGKQAIDDDANQTGQMLATLWGRPQATFASKLEVAGDKATAGRGHHRPAPQRTALHQAAGHHEGQEQAAGDDRLRRPRRREWRSPHDRQTRAAAEAQQGRDGEGRRRAGLGAARQGPGVRSR
jgi:hypothetical protein